MWQDSRNYYNDSDPNVCLWQRQLIIAGLAPLGRIDSRSIHLIKGSDLDGFAQCHFFAGILGWVEALRLAGWPAGRSVWTASCPCQPFSCAGEQKGVDDARHLWPTLFRLICERQPDVIFGEQVANAIGHDWLDGISAGLEAEGYAVGACVLGAHSVGAPHIRQRLYWVAVRVSDDSNTRLGRTAGQVVQDRIERSADGGRLSGGISNGGCVGSFSSAFGGVHRGEKSARARHEQSERSRAVADDGISVAGETERDGGREERLRSGVSFHITDGGATGRLGDGAEPRLEGYAGDGNDGGESGRIAAQSNGHIATSGAWGDFVIVPCADGKARRLESGLEPLAHGVPARVVRLRGYGNAIVPHVAAEFIKAFLAWEQHRKERAA